MKVDEGCRFSPASDAEAVGNAGLLLDFACWNKYDAVFSTANYQSTSLTITEMACKYGSSVVVSNPGLLPAADAAILAIVMLYL